MSPTQTSRRPLAAAVIAAAAVAFAWPASSAIVTTIGRPQDDDPDAELIAIANDAMAASVQLYEWDLNGPDMTEAEAEAAIERAFRGGDRLMNMRPVTQEGFLAKARFVRLHFLRLVVVEPAGSMKTLGAHHERLVWSLLNDLLPGEQPV